MFRTDGYRFRADFEPHDAMWIAWPNYFDGFVGTNAVDQTKVTMDMAKALTPFTKVKVTVDPASENDIRKTMTAYGIDMTRVELVPILYDDIPIRDWGPYYITNGVQKKIVHLPFTYWGYSYDGYQDGIEQIIDDDFPVRVARLENLDMVNALVAGEGGDRTFDGQGTMMAILPTELQRNQSLTQQQMETEYKQIFGISNIVWLKYPIVEDSVSYDGVLIGPDGVTKNAYSLGANHIDEVAQFAPNGTILLAEVTEAEAATHPVLAKDRRRLEANYAILKNAKDQNGNKYNIIRMPCPPLTYWPLDADDAFYSWFESMTFLDGSTFSGEPAYMIAGSSYINSIASNGVVLIPYYWHTGMPLSVKQKDDKAKQIYQSCYPGRQIAQIDAYAFNIMTGGGMHCMTQQEPAVRTT